MKRKRRHEGAHDGIAAAARTLFPAVGTVYVVNNVKHGAPYVLYGYPHKSVDVRPVSQLKNGVWLVLGYEKRDHRYGDSRDYFIILTNGSCVGIFELHLFRDMINDADYRNATATELT